MKPILGRDLPASTAERWKNGVTIPAGLSPASHRNLLGYLHLERELLEIIRAYNRRMRYGVGKKKGGSPPFHKDGDYIQT